MSESAAAAPAVPVEETKPVETPAAEAAPAPEPAAEAPAAVSPPDHTYHRLSSSWVGGTEGGSEGGG